MQLRSERPRLFYPGHWGLFDGVLDAGEDFETALRELKEEVAHYISDLSYLTGFTFDFSFCGMGKLVRRYFEVIMLSAQLKRVVLGEGSAMKAFSAQDLLTKEGLVPYDASAI